MTSTRLSLAPPTLDLEGLPVDGVHAFAWPFRAGEPLAPVDLTGRAAALVLRPGAPDQVVTPLSGGVDGVLAWVPSRAWRGPMSYALLLADVPGAEARVVVRGLLTHGVVVTGG